MPGPRTKRAAGKKFSLPHDLLQHFLRGVVYGLGFLASLVIVIPIALWALRTVEWVPLLGEFITDIVEEIEEARRFR